MKSSKILKVLLVLFLFTVNVNNLTGQPVEKKFFKFTKIVTKYTQLKYIISKNVNDTFFVYVRLPKHYNETNRRYPVIYLLDGDIAFNMATSIVRYLQYGKFVPDVITVGIGYGTMMSDEETNFRNRDYTPTQIEGLPNSGHASEYLKFIKKELIPFIDSTYRTDPDDRTLNGYSLGGLFTLYTMLKEPDLFNRYIAGSPYVYNDVDNLLKTEEKIFKEGNSLHGKLYITVGENESFEKFRNPISRIVNRLRKRQYKNFDLFFRIFENGQHLICPAEAMSYGLVYVYNNAVTKNLNGE